jgi:hypothetical protein
MAITSSASASNQANFFIATFRHSPVYEASRFRCVTLHLSNDDSSYGYSPTTQAEYAADVCPCVAPLDSDGHSYTAKARHAMYAAIAVTMITSTLRSVVAFIRLAARAPRSVPP